MSTIISKQFYDIIYDVDYGLCRASNSNQA